jgi:RAMP superfamily
LNAERHQPQGRKFYLHQESRSQEPPLWATTKPQNDLKQKVKVTPVRSGTQFWFHIDFDNLQESELALLRYALRPNEEFRHKLGMGKSLGLGQVRIDVAGIFFVNRAHRYSVEGLAKTRFACAWIATGEDLNQWPKVYEFERLAQANIDALPSFTPDPDIAQALRLLGKVDHANPVHTPTLSHDPHSEEEAFAWFVANERSPQPAFLSPIHRGTTSLPDLPNTPVREDAHRGPHLGQGRGRGASDR